MAWTTTDRDALKAAIKDGVRSVSYSDRTTTYGSLAEMREVLAMIDAELDAGSETPRPRVWLGSGSKGL
jgi:hypothetical protein